MSGDGKHDLYRVEYNSYNNKYEEQGNAYVDYFAPNIVNDTGNNYTLIFSSFPRKEIEASYSTDNAQYHKLILTEKELIPLITEGDIVLQKKMFNMGSF